MDRTYKVGILLFDEAEVLISRGRSRHSPSRSLRMERGPFPCVQSRSRIG